jgi:N-acyl-D-aspartate/D-glutamate deacylase
MALDPRIEAVRAKYELSRDDFWELPQKKGAWLVKHAALEVVAVKAGIIFDNPVIIEADTVNGIAALSVAGMIGDRREWATGEASPKNNKNAYPWAMAEKRAKDRVTLKLCGIHGLVYSEDESDDFKAPAAIPRISAFRAKQLLKTDVLLGIIDNASPRQLKELEDAFAGDLSFLPGNWIDGFRERMDARRQQLSGDVEPPPTPDQTLDRQYAETMRE